MTPIPPSGREPKTGDDVLDRILAEVRSAPETDDAPEEASVDDRQRDQLGDVLAKLSTAALSSEAQAAVEQLLAFGEGLPPETRQRMIAGAERGLRRQRITHGALAPLLAARREEQHLSAAALAREISLEETEVLAVEAGERGFRSLSPEQIVGWVGRLGIARERAVEALRRSLGLATAAATYAQRREPRNRTRHADDLALVAEVDKLLSGGA